jgi:hypothetical protein
MVLIRRLIGAVYDRYFSEVYRYVLYRVGDQKTARRYCQ